MGQSHKTNHTLNMQAFITLAMVAAASAAPQYAAAPVVHAVAAPDLAEPSPYTYTYAVADDYSKANFQQSESNDGTGAVTGSYSVNLPDGRIQTVTYNANDLTGNVATVEYSGTAAPPCPCWWLRCCCPCPRRPRCCPPSCPPRSCCCPRCPCCSPCARRPCPRTCPRCCCPRRPCPPRISS